MFPSSPVDRHTPTFQNQLAVLHTALRFHTSSQCYNHHRHPLLQSLLCFFQLSPGFGQGVGGFDGTAFSVVKGQYRAALKTGYGLGMVAPVRRVTGWDTPYPHAQEWAYFPGPERLGRAYREVMEAA